MQVLDDVTMGGPKINLDDVMMVARLDDVITHYHSWCTIFESASQSFSSYITVLVQLMM